MGVKMIGRYIGDKKTEITHLLSGAKLITAAPLDNNGDGSSFSPTDLTACSLGSCMLTVIAIVAERKELDITGSFYEVEKNMSVDPRRIGSLPLQIHLPASLDDSSRTVLERSANMCPVGASLHDEVRVELSFVYDV